MNRLVAIALGATLVFAAAACGDDDDDDNTPDAASAADAATPDATPAPTLAELCAENGGLFIDFFGKLFECQGGLFEVLIGSLPDDAELSALCEGSLDPFLDDGTAVLGDRDAFEACRDYIDNLTCAEADFDVPNPCDDVIVGQIPIDGDCDSNDQCAGDTFCLGRSNVTGVRAMHDRLLGDKPAPTGGAICGVCKATLANGQVCGDSPECSSGYCKELEAAPSECAAIGAISDACESSQDCTGTTVCAPGTLLCASEPTWALDTPCTTFIFDCGGPGADLMCHPGTAKCIAWLDVTDACDQSETPASYCRFFQYETCQEVVPGGGVFQCRAPMTVGAGATCGFFAGAKCGTGLVCYKVAEDTEICVTQAGLDGDCSGTAQCDFFLNCVADTCSYSSYTGMCPAP